ncbi:unnamed protein product [Mytilus edulis]|uniref:Uncharacterized protein n=1 Tax=Mytilus edulis TaxID=6550 RepID=A0A8S3RVZ0_MYTED|nr:unnamed protein product [Mytilus edulis]
MEKEIEKKAKAVIAKQDTEVVAETKTQEELSSAGRSKIKYLTGACVQKISKRFKKNGSKLKKSKLSMRMDYKKQALLKQFRINELDMNENDDSMAEIDLKQGPSRGLTIPNGNVFDFFLSLNNFLQKKLSPGQIHLLLEELHNHCRTIADSDDALLSKWSSLFDVQDDDKIEDELFNFNNGIISRRNGTFIRIAFVD